MDIVFSDKCLEYAYFGHVESPERVSQAIEILKTHGYRFIEPEPASEKEILLVHTQQWVERVKKGGYFDVDTPGSEDIYKYASLAVGGALKAAQNHGFSMLRPPGHHAGRNGTALGVPTLGFCYFNNIAVAIKYLNKQTLILDIDGHHGNGTQEIVLGDPKITYVSLHKSPHYPGTGLTSEKNCLNFPLPFNTNDRLFLKTFDKALSLVHMKNIEVIGISAGFDAHGNDMASLGLSSECFSKIGKKIGEQEKEVFGVLEGGYIGQNIGIDLHHLIQGLET